MTGPAAAGGGEELLHGRYRTLRPLGHGSFASVSLCADERTGRQVAVKELRPEHLRDWKHFELFEREARVLASLRHHGIPEVVEAFEESDAQGRPRLYLAEEYVEGAGLLARIEAGPRLGSSELLRLALDLLHILEYLHSRTPPVIHRDIKPSNIILRPTGAPVLIDFGGVRDGWRQPGQGGSTVLGTHGYAPPEQYLGQAGPKSDLYALGATLLHAAGGLPPSDYTFDTGRIEVPAELPCDSRLRRLLTALLEPAPVDRPANAAAARELLLRAPELVDGRAPGGQPQTSTPATSPAASGPSAAASSGAAALVGRSPRRGALSIRRSGDVTMAHAKAPRFVDLGPAPRDRNGPLADVHQNMIAPRDQGPVAFWVLMFVLTFVSFGLVPLIALANIYQRKRRFDPLFERGTFTEGHLVSVTQHGGRFTFLYEFDVRGVTYRGTMTNVGATCSFFAVGDRVGVLYDPANVSHNCFVYRTQGQALKAAGGR